MRANRARTDLAGAYPGSGTSHGYDVEVRDLAPGARSVCVYGISVGEGGNSLLGCRTGTVSSDPFGRLDLATVQNGMLRVAGWAIDPNTDNPTQVHVYIDGTLRLVLPADLDRPDIGRAHGRGDRHGFDGRVTITHGRHVIRVYAVNLGPGAPRAIGSTTRTWSGSPFGYLDSVTPLGGGRVRVVGWAIDPNAATIQVHIYVDGRGVVSVSADRERSDLASLGRGTAHGFDATVTVGAGGHSVCAYAINVGAGGNVRLGCRSVTAT